MTFLFSNLEIKNTIYDINSIIHEKYGVVAVGSEEEHRSQTINKKFDLMFNELKSKSLLSELQIEEVEAMKYFIASEKYKKNLSDIDFYENELFLGVNDFFASITNSKITPQDFVKYLENENWNIAPDLARKSNKDFNGFLKNTNSSEDSFGFLDRKKSLNSYASERGVAIFFEKFESNINLEKTKLASNKTKIKNKVKF